MSLRLGVLPLAIALPTFAQSSTIPTAKPFEGKFDSLTLKSAVFHFHPLMRNCKDQPDYVFGKSGSTYDACIGGKQVCSKEKVTIPQSLIAEYDDRERMRKEAVAESRRKGAAISAALAESRKGHDVAMAQHRARFSERRQPGASGLTVPVPGSGAPISSAPQTAPPPPIAEELAREIVPGATRAGVIAKLGQPYMRVSGDYERLTYLLVSGNTAKFELENGKVTAARIVPGQ